MITVINGVYTIQLPEFGVDQNIDPHTGHPFANEAAAQAWADEFVAQQAAQQAASVAAEQARLAAIIHVEATADKPRAMVGDLITLTGRMVNGLGQVVPMTDQFAVPVENEQGEVILIKLAEFVDGEATVSFTPTRSGYYCVTQSGINHKLPDGVHIGMPEELEIVVYE